MMMDLETRLKAQAQRLGFSLVGIAAATEADHFDRFLAWLEQEHHGQMGYMAKHVEARRRPEKLLEAVRSVVVVGMDDVVARGNGSNPSATPPFEGGESRTKTKPNHGKIARYAAGRDYHETIWRKLDELQAWLQTEVPGCRTRGVCDTAPLLERDFARRAGLGWVGKNTMLINKHRGSYVMLGAMLTDLELKPDQPHEAQHCGTCTRCLAACPTDAFPEPGVLDARKCISYLTIEIKGPLTQTDRPLVGDWLYGCDICQDVCPWNRKTVEETELVDARHLLAMDDVEFRNRFKQTTMYRSRRRGLARNAALVLGSTGDESAIDVLQRALNEEDLGVREAAAWAIEQIQKRNHV